MKRSRSIRLVLIGGLSTGLAVGGCGRAGAPTGPVNTENVYTNNFYLPGVGYYHAPFRAWYALPYNHQVDPTIQHYYQGGVWGTQPHESITNLSSPTVEAAQQAAARRTDVPRGGFGQTARHHSFLA